MSGDLHTAEIQFVYGNAWPPVVHTFDARDLQMVQATQQYWLSMAEYGNPNQLSSFTWPSYNTTIRANMRLDQPLFVEKDYRADICDSLWNNFPF
jgi:carboxylesterase type B